jgi:PAS domain-containing protein
LAHELLQTDYLGADPSQLLQQVQTHGVWKGEVCHHHRDGHPITILTTVTWMRDPHGGAIGTICLNRDISERKRGEQAMQHATERLRILADASHAFAEAGAEYQALLERIARISADRLHAACSIRLRSDDG